MLRTNLSIWSITFSIAVNLKMTSGIVRTLYPNIPNFDTGMNIRHKDTKTDVKKILRKGGI